MVNTKIRFIMKKIFITYIAMTVALILSSCVKENGGYSQDNQVCRNIITVLNAPTKTILGEGGAVVWAAEEDIVVISENTAGDVDYRQYTMISNNGETASFEGELPSGYVAKYVVYPYSKDVLYDPDKGIFLSIEEDQQAVNGSFAHKANVSVGVINDRSTILKNVGSLSKFTLNTPNVTSVVFSADAPVSGDIYVDPATGNIRGIASGNTTITMTAEAGTIGSGEFYMVTLPGSYKTLNMTVNTADDVKNTATKTWSGNYAFLRNNIYDFKNEADWGLDLKFEYAREEIAYWNPAGAVDNTSKMKVVYGTLTHEPLMACSYVSPMFDGKIEGTGPMGYIDDGYTNSEGLGNPFFVVDLGDWYQVESLGIWCGSSNTWTCKPKGVRFYITADTDVYHPSEEDWMVMNGYSETSDSSVSDQYLAVHNAMKAEDAKTDWIELGSRSDIPVGQSENQFWVHTPVELLKHRIKSRFVKVELLPVPYGEGRLGDRTRINEFLMAKVSQINGVGVN